MISSIFFDPFIKNEQTHQYVDTENLRVHEVLPFLLYNDGSNSHLCTKDGRLLPFIVRGSLVYLIDGAVELPINPDILSTFKD